ncbi:hypothetical protein [Leptospira alstonii]|uniref:Uncharacterized protein n=2 Tax=Leptospira alstonii TaxID=28452 RepID=M6CZW7_9LEPT|nr:hypothetical protein [Leptospira alstonii]EMJ95981.1 hypothetical protein LEP1GSC194_0309 [Leptospira alstonii serovar Sichuan str. 79601]EQA79779.1 hypothetical protein LEP1GSC193_2285 [Leptospira alstonii serovar Pingchang str. 80-412]
MNTADACGIIVSDINTRTKVSIWIKRNIIILKKIKFFKDKRLSLFLNRINDSRSLQGDLNVS